MKLINWLKNTNFFFLKEVSIYNLLSLYFNGLIKGMFTYRSGSVAFSFFLAIFPFLLFVLNLIPYISIIDNFQSNFLIFIEEILPPQTSEFFSNTFHDIARNKRGGLLSTVGISSIFLTANGINALFGGFENSYHIEFSRSILKQYLTALGVAIMIVTLLLILLSGYIYMEILIYNVLKTTKMSANVGLLNVCKLVFLLFTTYLFILILYRFGSKEIKQFKFFSLGSVFSLCLIVIASYVFGLYITNFSQYNELYGSIGAVLILMIYIWICSNVLLLGFELNATVFKLKNNKLRK